MKGVSSTTAKSPAATSERRARIRKAWILLAVFVALVAGGVLILKARGRARRQAAIDHIITSKEALMPSELKSISSRQGTDPSAWLASAGATKDLWEVTQIVDAHAYDALRAEAMQGHLGEDARAAFERFEACIRPWLAKQPDSSASWNEFWADISMRLGTGDGTVAFGECEPAAFQLLAAGRAPSMKFARAARGLAPIDPQRVAKKLDEADADFPQLPVAQESRIADAVEVTALFDAQSQRFQEALDDLRAGLDAADVHRPSFWLLGYIMWNLSVERALGTLELILPLLPRGLDVTDIEMRLTAMSPPDELANALRGERAFGYRVFESLRSGWTPANGAPYARSSMLARMRRWIAGDEDEAAYLDAMADAIDLADKPAFLRKELPPQPTPGFFTSSTSVILPSMAPVMGFADALSARLALARMALSAYRGGGQDALTFLSKSVDPYSGRPLSWGTVEGGLIVFWSVGPDRVDDGGKSESDDVTWTLRLAE
jgi:hypothetical protein